MIWRVKTFHDTRRRIPPPVPALSSAHLTHLLLLDLSILLIGEGAVSGNQIVVQSFRGVQRRGLSIWTTRGLTGERAH